MCCILICAVVNAQAPLKINYQAVIRDSAGKPLPANRQVSIRYIIHNNTPAGPNVFSEDGTAITNPFGLINLPIGSSNNLASVNWGNGEKYLQVLVDINGGTNYVDMGTSQLISVPYALFAANSLNGPIGPTGPTGPSGGPAGPTGATGPSGGPAGPTGPTGPTGISNIMVHAVRGTTDVTVPRCFDTAVVYVDAPEMTLTFIPTKPTALVTFSASGNYTSNGFNVVSNAQSVYVRLLVNGVYTRGQASAWLTGAADVGQSLNTNWSGHITVPVSVGVGLPTTIKVQWCHAVRGIAQFNTLHNNIQTDPQSTSHRSLSVIQY